MIVGIDMKFYEFVEFEMDDSIEPCSDEFWDILQPFMEEHFGTIEEFIISIKQPDGKYSIV